MKDVAIAAGGDPCGDRRPSMLEGCHWWRWCARGTPRRSSPRDAVLVAKPAHQPMPRSRARGHPGGGVVEILCRRSSRIRVRIDQVRESAAQSTTSAESDVLLLSHECRDILAPHITTHKGLTP